MFDNLTPRVNCATAEFPWGVHCRRSSGLRTCDCISRGICILLFFLINQDILKLFFFFFGKKYIVINIHKEREWSARIYGSTNFSLYLFYISAIYIRLHVYTMHFLRLYVNASILKCVYIARALLYTKLSINIYTYGDKRERERNKRIYLSLK